MVGAGLSWLRIVGDLVHFRLTRIFQDRTVEPGPRATNADWKFPGGRSIIGSAPRWERGRKD